MSDQLDNDLKNRIREVFDNYTDDTADAGWELLRQKFPEEKKNRVIAWWWYSAAAVLLVCMGTWFFYPQPTQQVAYQPDKIKNEEHKSAPVDNNEAIAVNKNTASTSLAAKSPAKVSTDETTVQVAAKPPTQKVAPLTADATLPKSTGISTAPVAHTMQHHLPTKEQSSENNLPANAQPLQSTRLTSGESFADKQTEKTIRGTVKTNNGIQIAGASTLPTGITVNQYVAGIKAGRTTQSMVKVNPLTTDTQTNAITDSAANNASAKIATIPQPVKPTQVASVVVQKQDAVLKMIAADDARRQVLAKNATQKSEVVKNDRAMILSLYAATYFNYAKGSENQLNVGGGFSSDFKISSNFKLTTGLSIGQNRLSYSSDNNIPQQVNARALAMVNKTAAAAVVYNSSSFVSSALRDAGPTVKNYNASLVGLDIPLNIKYQFNPQKNDTYISAGISSGTYINESYRSTYSYGNANGVAAFANGLATVNSATQQTQESTTTQHFSTFDFAKTLNLSFGIGYPMGKNTRLVIEPFLKYPLNGLGTQDIRFGASGINLKLSFSSKK
ncbi:outer membrane beta-barrel protein [Mucilaginibacter polytrichastri]|uniref:Uncharacterized protein n=1 Tax=Mucilaginibacter polytrichastri TaxID=1302689 RepID=A0A1Q5ZU75_9SPHI|nr:outer membrane beta-barrel protein [Mucilaginibacter polytrichastri]OKS85306.1 hypothetical protein RG47T_0750 [Mucilaginibacter polytrichastri]SFS41004.1 Outer membrane protein beta-barrel domain-containing protein [Mucilaginibacter polytrichastri]